LTALLGSSKPTPYVIAFNQTRQAKRSSTAA